MTKTGLVHQGGTRFRSEPCASLVSGLNREAVTRGAPQGRLVVLAVVTDVTLPDRIALLFQR